MLFGAVPAGAALALAALVLRLILCRAVERAFGLPSSAYWLIPLRALFSFAVFVRSLFGGRLTWRGHDFALMSDGTLLPDGDRSPR
jgi:ceramide glucosyltransferase